MKTISKLPAFLLCVVLLAACNKSNDGTINPVIPEPKTVYITGYVLNTAGISDIRYWKNGNLTVLLHDGTANAITSSGSDIYIAADSTDAIGALVTGASYWKNGVKFPIADWGRTTGISVSGGDVYVSGFKNNSGAIYWKNGIKVTLSTGGGVASGITVVGSDVYVLGSVWNGVRYVPTYWKNSTVFPLTNGTADASSNGIAVSGGDVYVAGYMPTTASGSIAVYWKNGVQVALTTNVLSLAYTSNIAVQGSDVYVCGQVDGTAVYWKNGVRVDLASGAGADAIFISGTDVYVAGTVGSGKLVYWRNGQMTTVATSSTQVHASGIVVQ